MSDPRTEPHGPERMPDEQPVPDPTDLANQEALQQGAASRWLVPAGVLAVIAGILFALGLTLQVVLPVVGLVYVVGMWALMLVVSRRGGEVIARNRRLAWLMGALAVGAFLIMLGIYLAETVPDAFS